VKPCAPGLKTDASPSGETTATAVSTSTSVGTKRAPTAANLISRASIFLPKYSGVRPTISPATKTAIRIEKSSPYIPEPTPPKITSPTNMLTSGTAPPAGVNASCPPLTEPLEASVVAVAQSAVLAMPKRTSLSCMFPPLWPCPCVMLTPEARSTGDACCSAGYATPTPIANIANIAAKIIQACRRASTMRPNMKICATGISRIAISSRKFVSPFGFSNGTAELALKKPPPFVPSCLIAIINATGPRAITCVAPSTV
jgi:hypothetical protein